MTDPRVTTLIQQWARAEIELADAQRAQWAESPTTRAYWDGRLDTALMVLSRSEVDDGWSEPSTGHQKVLADSLRHNKTDEASP